MRSQDIYLEIDFYKKFIDSLPAEENPYGVNYPLKQWQNFYELMIKSNIYLDINEQTLAELAKQDKESYNIFVKKWGSGNSVELLEDKFPNIDKFEIFVQKNKDLLKSIFLTSKPNNRCEEIENSYGIRVIGFENIYKVTNNIFNMHIEPIESGNKTHTDWSFMNKFIHPCNSIAVVDKYILKSEDTILENLLPILSIILPDKLKIPFHISVFSKNEPNIKKNYNFIKEQLKKEKPNLNFTLAVHELKDNKIHDRTIFTNYLLIESGKGFDLFNKKKATHQTKINAYYPFSVLNVNDEVTLSYVHLEDSLIKVYNQAVDSPSYANYCGKKENRLFEKT